MAKKYTQLPAGGSLTGTEILAVVQDGDSVQTTVQDIADLVTPSSSLTVTNWNFPAGAFPTSDGALYIATADHGVIGDVDYVPTGTWFVANTATPSGYSDFNYK